MISFQSRVPRSAGGRTDSIRALVLVLSTACADPATSVRAADNATRLADRCEMRAALEIVDQALATGAPSTIELLTIRARLLIQLGRSGEALTTLDGLAAKSGGAANEFVFLRALALADLGRTEDYERALAEAASSGTDADLVEQTRALGRIQDGRIADAEKILEGLVRRPNAMSGAWLNLGALRSIQGRLVEAEACARAGWLAGERDPETFTSEPKYAALVASGRIDDLLRTNSRRCAAW